MAILLAFRGATMYEFAVGRVWLTILRPRFICWRNLRNLGRVGLDRY